MTSRVPWLGGATMDTAVRAGRHHIFEDEMLNRDAMRLDGAIPTAPQ